MQASWEYPQGLFGLLVKSLDLSCTFWLRGGICFGFTVNLRKICEDVFISFAWRMTNLIKARESEHGEFKTCFPPASKLLPASRIIWKWEWLKASQMCSCGFHWPINIQGKINTAEEKEKGFDHRKKEGSEMGVYHPAFILSSHLSPSLDWTMGPPVHDHEQFSSFILEGFHDFLSKYQFHWVNTNTRAISWCGFYATHSTVTPASEGSSAASPISHPCHFLWSLYRFFHH